MKKTFMVVLFLFLSLCLFASCNKSDQAESVDYSKLEFILIEPQRIIYDELPEIEEASEMIIVAEITDNPLTEPGDDFIYIRSYSTLRVKQVLSGDVNIGDEIKIVQSCGVKDDQFISYSQMTPMLKGETWIFFLSRSLLYDDSYYCVDDCDGRYPLKNVSYQSTGLTKYDDLGVYNRDNFKDDIYNALIEKYDL